MMRYVAGFGITGDNVLLVRKNHPTWQYGLLNGIGGKVDDGETYDHAMRREYREETGIDVPYWDAFAQERGPGYTVMFYRASLTASDKPPALNDAGEPLEWHDMRHVDHRSIIGNVQWLLPLARDPRNIMVIATTSSNIKEKPTW